MKMDRWLADKAVQLTLVMFGRTGSAFTPSVAVVRVVDSDVIITTVRR